MCKCYSPQDPRRWHVLSIPIHEISKLLKHDTVPETIQTCITFQALAITTYSYALTYSHTGQYSFASTVRASRMELPRVRGQSHEVASAGLEFRTEATHKVYIRKVVTWIFPVSEDSGAADVGATFAQPDPQVLGFISAADFKQGLKRTNEMMENFKNRSQPLWMQLMMFGSFALMIWTILASSVANFAGISEYPTWASIVGWVAVIGSCAYGASINQKQEKTFRENVETELKEVWKNAVAQGVGVAFENEHSGSGENNTYYPAAVTITLPYGARGAVSAIEAQVCEEEDPTKR